MNDLLNRWTKLFDNWRGASGEPRGCPVDGEELFTVEQAEAIRQRIPTLSPTLKLTRKITRAADQ